MIKSLTVSKYEFFKNVKRKDFFLMTFGFPLLTILLLTIPAVLMNSQYTDNQMVGYIDQANLLGEISRTIEESQYMGSIEENKHTTQFVKYIDNKTAIQDLESGKISEILVFPSNYLKTGIVYYYAAEKAQSIPEEELSDVIITVLLKNKVDENILVRVKDPLSLKKLDSVSNNYEFQETKIDIKNLIIPLSSAILLCFSILSSSGYLLKSITEEKENRVIEILLSSVTHQELLVGKTIGLGALGLLQMMIWVFVIIMGAISYIAIYVELSLLVLIFVYYLLGYLLYASIMAGIGIISGPLQSGQQISGIISLIAFLPLLLIQVLIASPNSEIAIFLSMFPLTSAVSMMSRVAVTSVPFYQIIMSVTILLISIYLGLILFSRMFRVELLMYGKKPDINELIRYFFTK
ncbi:hypothetical protein DU74_09260 [Methanosarcina mazei]|uniref:ABC-2 type transporter transmembrane domain-containing protein n=1 Tax=Methanosarcina mazei TaxID=2209 RepID=A0A0F8RSF4_METMZ|nr:ABC transporter permease [Methanosarcina mazei]KKH57616.1 hypothetical protein DU74_09260 [Methanosarcina mazei]